MSELWFARLLRFCIAVAVGLLCSLAYPGPAWMSPVRGIRADEEAPSTLGYEVRAGDTLASIALRYGLTVREVMRDNAVQDPRQIHMGQILALRTQAVTAGRLQTVPAGTDLLTLSRASGVELGVVARANHLLLPTGLAGGLQLWIPAGIPVTEAAPDPAALSARRVSAAVRGQRSLWDVLWLNRVPGAYGQSLLIPGATASGRLESAPGDADLPYPVVSLDVSSQPVARGETAVVKVATAEPVGCAVDHLDKTEACLPQDGTGLRWYGLIGLPPLMDTGVTTVNVRLATAGGAMVEMPVPLLVGAGRYDYERIDLPPDRQALLDPQLSQAETAKIAALRTLRSPVRYWTYPFRLPLESAVTSYFGSRRSYGYGFGSYHAGTDFDGEVGMPVIAPSAGVVVLAEHLVVRGNAILVDHGWGVVSGYWHLSQIDVEVGQEVQPGERIGVVGNTGLSTGAHLHWELWVNGVAVNVLSWLDYGGPASVLGPNP